MNIHQVSYHIIYSGKFIFSQNYFLQYKYILRMSSFLVNKQGLNIAHSQNVNLPQMKHESVIIPATSAPAWGSYFVIDFRERNCILHDLTLQFNVSALTGYTSTNSTSPRYTPAFFWFTRIEIVQNNVVIDTIYPAQQF